MKEAGGGGDWSDKDTHRFYYGVERGRFGGGDVGYTKEGGGEG